MYIAEVDCGGLYTKLYCLFFVLRMFGISYVEVIRLFKKHEEPKDWSLLGSNRTYNSSGLGNLTFKYSFGQLQDLYV